MCVCVCVRVCGVGGEVGPVLNLFCTTLESRRVQVLSMTYIISNFKSEMWVSGELTT